RRRLERGDGLWAPELAVLLAWTKIVLADELIATELPDDPWFAAMLFDYFPQRMRETYRAQIEQPPLRREIVVTQVVNEVVNGAGMTFWPRLAGETGLAVDELVRAHFAAREIFGAQEMRAELATWDNKLPAALQTRMRLEVRTLIERA